MKPRAWFLSLGLAALAMAMIAGATMPQQEGPPRFSSSVQVVEVYATVTDAMGGPVTGLTQEDFEVSEDGHPREITTFAAGEFPLTVALGVDRSFSMAGERLRLAKLASKGFLDALRPDDRSMVVAIGSDAEILASLATDRATQRQAIDGLDAWSTTALFDAVMVSLDRLEPEPGRQALVVFSDGVDRYSRATGAGVVARARRSAALVYPVVIGRSRPPVLAELAAATGGRSFLLKDARGLDGALQTIARELRYQYLLGYMPVDAASEPHWHSIRVTLKTPRPGVRIRARDGYFS